jgi:hypothetical protein
MQVFTPARKNFRFLFALTSAQPLCSNCQPIAETLGGVIFLDLPSCVSGSMRLQGSGVNTVVEMPVGAD